MPSTQIDFSGANKLLNLENPEENLISTPYGLAILEIQGELNLPNSPPDSTSNRDSEYMENFVKIDTIYDAVKFGKLVFDDNDKSIATLFIGKSQRLLGKLEKLETPLAVLRIPNDHKDASFSDNKEVLNEEKIKIIDVIKKKLIFKQRPLPIM